MREIVLSVVGHHAPITTEIARFLVKQRPELERDLAELQLRVRGFLTSLCEGVVYGTSVHVSQVLGAVPPERTLRSVLASAPDNNIYRLIDLASHLDHFDSLPADKLDALSKAFAKKPSPTNVLRRLVYRHLYLFPVESRVRRQLCTRFNIKEQRLLEARQGRH